MNVNPSFPIEAETPIPKTPLAKWLGTYRWFILVVVVPTALAAFYFGLIASDVYISESRFVIKSADQKRSQTSTLANLVRTTGLSGSQEQTNEVLAFVRSRDALKALEAAPGVRDRYGLQGVDSLSRFPGALSAGSFEELFNYYGDMVDARLETGSGTAIIKVKAFTPGDAYQINRRLLELSEALVNRLNERARTTRIAEAQRQLDLTADRAKAARVALTRYRNAQSVIDPTKQAGGVIDISNGLVAERAALQAQVSAMQDAAPGNPSIAPLRSRIDGITAQIAAQDGRVVGTGSGIASKIGGYEDLLAEQEFATESMTVSSAALVQVRAEAQRQQYYLERVVDPNLPDTPLLPKRLRDILIVFATVTCLYSIARIFLIGVIEHAPEEHGVVRSRLRELREGWGVQLRVTHALMIRELTTRFGRENIGFLWIMVEPLLFASLVGLIWRLTKGAEEHGISVVAFIATGYIPITMFRNGIGRSVAVFTVNSSLLYHRQVKILDFIIVRFIIEILGGMMAYVFMATILIVLGEFPVPSNIGLLIAGWFLYAFFAFAVCLVIAPLSEMSEVLEKFVPVTTYIMIPFSGLFYMAAWVTPEMREYILFSPFVNCMEMMRKGVWGDQITSYYNVWNPLACSIVLVAIGLSLCRHVRRTLAVE